MVSVTTEPRTCTLCTEVATTSETDAQLQVHNAATGNVKNGPGIDNLLAFTTYSASGTNTYYALTDHLGTVHALADESGSIVESYRFDAWGRVIGVYDADGTPLTESAVGNHYLWQGRWYSWNTGLYYFRARWYDPVTGRWLSKDPIGISGGLNQYVFAGNNPVNYVDPFGLDSIYIYGDSGWAGLVEERAGANYDAPYRAQSMEDAANFVENYAKHIGPVDEVILAGHGNDGYQEVGSEMVALSMLVGRVGPLERIAAAMEKSGAIHFKACWIARGTGDQFLQDVANATGIRTTGSTGIQFLDPVTGKYFTFGKTVEKSPQTDGGSQEGCE